MWRRLSIALFAWAALPSVVGAQQRVQVCLPEAATRDMRDALSVELRARGHDVIIECASIEPLPAWVLSLEAEDALADVWVHAVAATGEQRQARAGGPLDALDERALALTAASLLDEETVIPEPSSPPEASAPPALITTPSHVDPVEPEAEATAAADATPAPVELVESDRTLSPLTMLEFGAVGGLISGELGTIGGRLGFGLHVAPWLRLRIPIAFSVAPGRGIDFAVGMGFDVSISLVRGESWIEIGISARYALRTPLSENFLGIGPGLNAAIFYALSDSWRVFVRGEGTALFDTYGEQGPQYGLYLSAGFAVFL